jgi:hypothetical protein
MSQLQSHTRHRGMAGTRRGGQAMMAVMVAGMGHGGHDD